MVTDALPYNLRWDLTREFGVRLYATYMYVKSRMYLCVYVCVFASRKESAKEAERLNGVTTRQSHRLGIVWTKPSKSTANRPRFASLCVSITTSLPSPSTRTREPSFFRYLSWGALPSSSHSILFLERTIGRNTAETAEGRTANREERRIDFMFLNSVCPIRLLR